MKNKLRFVSSTLAVIGVAALAACSSSSAGDDGSSEDATRIKPKGSENWSNLTVQLPTGSCQPGGSCSNPLGAAATIMLDSTNVGLGVQSRVKPGAHTVTVNGTTMTLNLVAGKSKTLTLPIAHRKCQAANLPNVTATDFGKNVTLANGVCPTTAFMGTGSAAPTVQLHWYNWNCPTGNIAGSLSPSTQASDCASLGTNQIYSISINGVCTNLTATSGIPPQAACTRYLGGDYSWATGGVGASFADTDRAFVPGTYSVGVTSSTGNAATQTFTLAEGAISEIPVNLAVVGSVPSTFATNVSFADARELPDATVATITSSCGGDRTYSVPATSTTTLKLKAFAASECVYTLNAGGRTQTLDQSKANPIALHRIDVDHPLITREDGSTYSVSGSYELFFGGARVIGPVTTNTGIDVLPGDYELVTKFSTSDGPQVQRDTLQF